ncbi:MAG: glycosyltransferase [Kordiimonadaceae bacterium]|nr:glycosyltransferase [Kordiimonadaceae bacterium]MBO6569326.1 glycosyltransferase [Kordiimonadaceae bacterium]MBO6964802.1 glycosyltransferase [Kordiimonadaceae bacterium]
MMMKLLSQGTDKSNVFAVVSLLGRGVHADAIERLKIPLYTFNLKSPLGILHFLFVAPYLAMRFKADITQGWMYHGNLAAVYLNFFAKRNSKLAWNIRVSLEHYNRYGPFKKMSVILGAVLSNLPDVIINNSKMSIEEHTRKGYVNGSVKYIPNGFDLNKFTPSKRSREIVRKELGLLPGQFVFGFFGHYGSKKGFNFLFEATSLLISMGHDVQLLLAGRGVDEGNRGLVDYVSKSNLEKHVLLLGEVDRIEEYYPALDGYVQPSLTEGFSNSIGEACCCAVPCVATDVGDAKLILENIGSVVPAGSGDALMMAMLHLLQTERVQREAMGRRAREKFRAKFELGKVVKMYQKVYRETT